MEAIVEKIEQLLAAMRPAFQRDRGDIEFVRFVSETGVVEVRMHGMCRGCGLADFTLKFAIEDTLKEQVPGVQSVVAVP